MNKFNLNQNQNTMIFIEENVLENTVCKMVATLSQPQCVKNAAVCHSGLNDEGFFWVGYIQKCSSCGKEIDHCFC